MSRTVKAYYSFALDGGANGAHILRGGRLGDLVFLMTVAIVTTEPFSIVGGTLIDLGWTGNPSGLYSGIDPSGFLPTVPVGELYVPIAYPRVHFASVEPIILTISGGGVLAGALEVAVEVVRV
jgi:hypothetical protein